MMAYSFKHPQLFLTSLRVSYITKILSFFFSHLVMVDGTLYCGKQSWMDEEHLAM